MPRATRTTGVRSRRKLNTKNNHKKKSTPQESEIESVSDKSDSEQSKQEQQPEPQPQSEEPKPQQEQEDEEEEYFPERIVDHRVTNGEKEYYVKWKDWSSDDNTWEPQNHLSKVPKLVERYEQSVTKKQANQDKKVKKKFKKQKPVSIESSEASNTPKLRRKKKRISSLTPDEDEYDNKSPQIITKRQKRKSFPNKNASRFSDDDDDYKPSMSVDDNDDNDDEYDMDIDSKRVVNKQKSSEIESDDGDGDDESSDAESEESEPTYTVEAIVKHRKSLKKKYAKKKSDGKRCMEYYVKWKDWDETTNTWEHESELIKCKKLIDQYWEGKNQEKEMKKNKIKNKKKESDKKKEEKQIESEEKEKKIVNKKIGKKKKYKARRTNIFSDEMNGNQEHDDEDIKDKNEEDVNEKNEEDGSEINVMESEKNKQSRKRKLCEDEEEDNDGCDGEPPSKKRRIDKTKKVVMENGGLDAFLFVLNEGDEDDQEMLMSMVEKYEKRNFG